MSSPRKNTVARPGSSTAPPRLAVLASGAGSILEAIIAAGLPVSLVLTDRPCRALEIAAGAGVPTALVDRGAFNWPAKNWDRRAFTAAASVELHAQGISLIAMSGFMTLFSPEIFSEYKHRILNTHPSLLPAFKGHGARVIADTLAAGAIETGCTVQIATHEIDAGPILAQERVPVIPGDTPDILWERIKKAERRLYPATIRSYLAKLTSQ